MGEGDARDLDELRWHWGDAYLIEHFPGPGKWVAQRRDSHSTFSAADPEALLEKIRADYAVRPVPRPRAAPMDCRFRPEA